MNLPAGQQIGPAAVRVPGSTSNLGGGFDCVALAIDRFLDVVFEPGAGPLAVVRSDSASLGQDLVALSFQRTLEERGVTPEGTLHVTSGIPIGCGLGSSAAALVAGTALAELAAGAPIDPGVVFALRGGRRGSRGQRGCVRLRGPGGSGGGARLAAGRAARAVPRHWIRVRSAPHAHPHTRGAGGLARVRPAQGRSRSPGTDSRAPARSRKGGSGPAPQRFRGRATRTL